MNQIPVINMTATGKNIAALRVRAGLSVRDVQEIFGFATPQAIYKWQNGTAMPTIDNLVILAKNFNVKNKKQQIYRAIISKYGQEKGLNIYNHIKKNL